MYRYEKGSMNNKLENGRSNQKVRKTSEWIEWFETLSQKELDQIGWLWWEKEIKKNW